MRTQRSRAARAWFFKQARAFALGDKSSQPQPEPVDIARPDGRWEIKKEEHAKHNPAGPGN